MIPLAGTVQGRGWGACPGPPSLWWLTCLSLAPSIEHAARSPFLGHQRGEIPGWWENTHRHKTVILLPELIEEHKVDGKSWEMRKSERIQAQDKITCVSSIGTSWCTINRDVNVPIPTAALKILKPRWLLGKIKGLSNSFWSGMPCLTGTFFRLSSAAILDVLPFVESREQTGHRLVGLDRFPNWPMHHFFSRQISKFVREGELCSLDFCS